MESEAQSVLVEIPEQPIPQLPPVPKSAVVERKAKVKPIDRDQGLLRSVIVDELVGPDHKARAIWDLSGQLDLSGIQAKIRSREGQAGRAAWDPRLLLSVWL